MEYGYVKASAVGEELTVQTEGVKEGRLQSHLRGEDHWYKGRPSKIHTSVSRTTRE